MTVRRLHHVAYRCRDAVETTAFYRDVLGLDFSIAVAENRVPSTGAWSPHIHVFFAMEDGSSVAFFELPESGAMGFDPNTPDWVQHLALAVPDEAALEEYRKRLLDAGIEVVGPTDHGMCRSIYFFDPNGHRLELSVDTMTPELERSLRDRADGVLEQWSRTKRAPDVDPMHAHTRTGTETGAA